MTPIYPGKVCEINEFGRARRRKIRLVAASGQCISARGTLPRGGAFANATAVSRTELDLPPSTARTLKGPRRLVRRSARRGQSPRWQFLRGFLKNPVMVGSIIPSSRVLIEKMLGRVDWENTKLFVEYGPGVGTFTRPILDNLASDATLLTVDTNADFTTYLRESIDDPRLVPVTGSAADIEKILADRGLPDADFVLSGLPFSTLPPGVGEAIAEATSRVIRPGGAFLVYQFSPKVLDFIQPHFDKIDRGFEWINVPPATLFWAWKGDKASD
jgi:phospholipid N-methyltransferase